MKTIKRYTALAKAIGSMKRCEAAGNTEWADKHANAILALMDSAPSGSGIDSGTKLLDESTSNRLVFGVDFHHMDEGGCYDGWTEHKVVVTPAFEIGFDLIVTGRDRNGIKEYLGEVYSAWIDEEVEEWLGYEQTAVATTTVNA